MNQSAHQSIPVDLADKAYTIEVGYGLRHQLSQLLKPWNKAQPPLKRLYQQLSG